MTEPEIATRRAGAADLEIVMTIVEAGYRSYREFLPPQWRPPDMSVERRRIREKLAGPRNWALVACAGPKAVGDVGFGPGWERRAGDAPKDGEDRPLVPGLAHLWHLFVLPEWWGTEVAPTLHELALAEMRAQGYERARLFTPSLHARARRFYERRGWSAVDEQHNAELGLDMTEYRLDL